MRIAGLVLLMTLVACSEDPPAPPPIEDVAIDAADDAGSDVTADTGAETTDGTNPPDADATDTTGDTTPDATETVDTGPITCKSDEDCQGLNAPSGPCFVLRCNVPTGQCVEVPTSGEPCDDGDPCTANDTCAVAGKCEGEPSVCDDGLPCTIDACDSETGACSHTPQESGPCDDGDSCTTEDTCDVSGQCSGEALDCNDDEACTTDLCDDALGGCVNEATVGTPCDDDDSCTTNDSCADSGACAGEPLCDDGDPCTDDSCDGDGGCVSTPNPLCGALYKTAFDCDEAGWDFVVTQGDVSWNIDALPDPPGYNSPECSLNFNADTDNYDSQGSKSAGYADSPEIDASGLANGASVYLSLWQFWETEDAPDTQYDVREIRVSTDDFETYTAVDPGHDEDANQNIWFFSVLELPGVGGATFKIRFFFDTIDAIMNEGVGWFIEDLEVTAEPPVIPPEACDDGEDNDYDLATDCDDSDCVLDAACTPKGDTCAAPHVIAADALPFVQTDNTESYSAHYGFPDGSCPGINGGFGGGLGQGPPDVVYAFTAPNDATYRFRLSDLGFDGLLYVVSDCEAIGASCVGGADDSLGLGDEVVDLQLAAGTSVFVIVDGWDATNPNNAGAYTLTVSKAPESDCNDGVDNDNNGAADCADPGCALAPNCLPESACFDGNDNDSDGQTDCDDADCAQACSEGDNCEDGVDNDSDGQTDCDDTDCAAAAPCIVEKCGDGIDNDGDGAVDCGDDECFDKGPCKDVGQSCSDAIPIPGGTLPVSYKASTQGASPNYGYGPGTCAGEEGGWGGGAGSGAPDIAFAFTPNQDANYQITLAGTYDSNLYVVASCANIDGTCLGASESPGAQTAESIALTLTAGETYFIIVDGWSNSSNNNAGDFTLTVALAGESSCDDGVDNDGNSATDCDDDACAFSSSCIPEGSCTDGVDGDGDGLTDCADPECSNVCDESANCDDATDNDGDGKIDCADSDCAGTPACIPENCSDGVDNDQDGDIDCADAECEDAVSCLAAGDICGKPLKIGNLPASSTGNTCDFENDIVAMAGGGCFLGGQDFPDVVYSFTPAFDMNVRFAIDPGATQAELVLNVTTACAPIVNTCLGGDNPIDGNVEATVKLQAGTTYSIVLDGFNFFYEPTCGPYVLNTTVVPGEAGMCSDGADNDMDGAADCDDSDCEDDLACACKVDADCPDLDACNVGVCDLAAGGCVTKKVSCDDGLSCTDDSCDAVTGCLNAPVKCDDGLACTVDYCTEANGCTSATDDTKCNDQSVCTTDACKVGVGCTHTDIPCDDGLSCTDDGCDPKTGCTFTGDPNQCDDGNPCTDDSCDPDAGCQNTVIPQCLGGSCETPLVMGALPFTSSGSTAAFDDNFAYGAGDCSVVSKGSLKLDGIDDRIELTQGPEFDYSETAGITISIWMKLPIGFANPGMVIVQGPSSWYISINGFQQVSWRPVAPLAVATPQGAMIEGVWNHLVATYDNTSHEALLYVNGIEVAAKTGDAPLNFYNGLIPAVIGRNWSALAPLPLSSHIDDVTIFPRALEPGEIMDLLTASNQAPLGLDPDHWWSFENDTFPVAVDSGASPVDGLLVSMDASAFEQGEAPTFEGAGDGSADIVYAFTPEADGTYRATLNPGFDAVLYVASNCENVAQTCLTKGVAHAGTDDALSFKGKAGVTVYLVVDGTQGGSGKYQITVEALE